MDSSVYLGVWTNWDHGKVYGLTLTTDQPWSDVLVAAAALVITFTATQIWGIICFIVFRVRQRAAGDYVHHSVQAALRNPGTPSSFAWGMLEIVCSQRAYSLPRTAPVATGLMQGFNNQHYEYSNHLQDGSSGTYKPRKSEGALLYTFARLTCLLLLVAVFSAGFTIVSLISNQFVKAADDSVLIASQDCGWAAEVSNLLDLATSEARDKSTVLMVPSRARAQKTRLYVRSCYAEANDAEISKQCNTFITLRIPSTMKIDQPCPFPGDGVCKTGAARIESGPIDSRTVLGINTRDEDRIVVTKTLTCVPIDADRWSTGWVEGEPFGEAVGDFINGYAVGTLPYAEPPASEYPFFCTKYGIRYSSDAYQIRSVAYFPGNETGAVAPFIPRDELKVSDADLTLIALSPNAWFDEQILDPWFNISWHEDSLGFDAWWAPDGFSILGCLEQYRFCASGSCSQPDALYQLRSSPTYGMGKLTAGQKAVADLVWKSLWAGKLQYALLLTGNEVLVANELVMGSGYRRSSKISTDQWALEAWNFANLSLATLQRRPGDYAAPAAVLLENPDYIVRPETDTAQALCQQIKIRTTRYTSFNVLSLALLAIASALVTTLNCILPSYFSKLSRRGQEKKESSKWDRYNLYHLIRSGCEARGIGIWDNRDKTIPAIREKSLRLSLQDRGWAAAADSSGCEVPLTAVTN